MTTVRPKSYYRHMTPAKADQVRRLYFKHRYRQAQLAERYRVSQATISRIVSGRVWSA